MNAEEVLKRFHAKMQKVMDQEEAGKIDHDETQRQLKELHDWLSNYLGPSDDVQ